MVELRPGIRTSLGRTGGMGLKVGGGSGSGVRRENGPKPYVRFLLKLVWPRLSPVLGLTLNSDEG